MFGDILRSLNRRIVSPHEESPLIVNSLCRKIVLRNNRDSSLFSNTMSHHKYTSISRYVGAQLLRYLIRSRLIQLLYIYLLIIDNLLIINKSNDLRELRLLTNSLRKKIYIRFQSHRFNSVYSVSLTKGPTSGSVCSTLRDRAFKDPRWWHTFAATQCSP